MEIRFYSPEMDFLGIMENQRSLIWRRKYFEPGDFELYAPITKNNLTLVSRGNLLWMKGSREAAVIEDIILEENSRKNEITVKGRFLSSYMERRLIKKTVNFSGKTEEAMRLLIQETEMIPGVELGELNGFDDQVEFQVTYKNLLSYIEKLARSSAMGFYFRPDFNKAKIYFETYKGVVRSIDQSGNNRVVFSERYNNLNNATYRENDQLYKNVVYVGGEGEGAERKYIKIGEASGLELRELFVDARDVQSRDLTAEEYEEKLKTRGREALESHIMADSFEFETGTEGNYSYRKDYDLGDVVTVKKEAWGIQENLRITQIDEVYEYGGRKVIPTFGNSLPEKIDWSENR